MEGSAGVWVRFTALKRRVNNPRGDEKVSYTPEHIADIKFQRRTIDTVIRIGILFILAGWCYDIIHPFIYPLAWGMVIAVATHRSYLKLCLSLGGRDKLTAILLTALILLVLFMPVAMLAESMATGVYALVDQAKAGELKVPPPPEAIVGWPIIGRPLDTLWRSASENIVQIASQFAPQLKAIGVWLLSAVTNAGVGVFQFILSIIVAGLLLAYSEASANAVKALATRLAGDKGVEFVSIAGKTINGVTRGMLGVAVIQALLAGIGFLLVGLPGAGLWAFIALILAVIQIGIIPVSVPAVIYVFSVAEPVTATLFLIWNIFISLVDNVLKPLLMSKDAAVPTPIVFLGATGGFMAAGILGLFLGAIILSIGYTLYFAWLEGDQPVIVEAE